MSKPGSYIILFTDEDGTERAFGPVGSSRADKWSESASAAFPECHARAVLLRSYGALADQIEEARGSA